MCSTNACRSISRVVFPVLWTGSRAASTSPVTHATTVDASVINPIELTEEHVSKVCCVARDDVKTVFAHGLPRKFAAQVEVLGKACWLLRRQSFDIMQHLKTTQTPDKAKFMIYGDGGSGKSLCLSQIVHWAVSTGWLVIQVPNVFSWTHSKAELRASSKTPDTYDQPQEAIAWLKNFKTANTKFLSEISLSEDHAWTKRERSLKGEPLLKVVDQGLLKPVIATDLVDVVLAEIIRARKNLLLAVDEFNGCFNPTSCQSNDKQWLQPQQLNLVQTIAQYTTTPGKFPGAVVVALSKTGMRRHHVTGHTPQQLLGEADFMKDSMWKSVEVPPYGRSELLNTLQYYSTEKWMNKELSESVSTELWHLSAGNPRELQRLCSSL